MKKKDEKKKKEVENQEKALKKKRCGKCICLPLVPCTRLPWA